MASLTDTLRFWCGAFDRADIMDALTDLVTCLQARFRTTRGLIRAIIKGDTALAPLERKGVCILALEHDAACGTAWYNLGVWGGGIVDGIHYSRADCYSRALCNDADDPKIWSNLGAAGGCAAYSGTQCCVRALELSPNFARAWVNLGTYGGGVVDGQSYTQMDCYTRALQLDPASRSAWYNAGASGGIFIAGVTYTKVDCYIRALEIDPVCSQAWLNLGVCGGGSVSTPSWGGSTRFRKTYSRSDCYVKALEADGSDGKAWVNLGLSGGGTVHGRRYTAMNCYRRALDYDNEDTVAKRCIDQCQPKPTEDLR